MGRDGALLPHRSHGESGPASRSYDKTSQLDSHRCFRLAARKCPSMRASSRSALLFLTPSNSTARSPISLSKEYDSSKTWRSVRLASKSEIEHRLNQTRSRVSFLPKGSWWFVCVPLRFDRVGRSLWPSSKYKGFAAG